MLAFLLLAAAAVFFFRDHLVHRLGPAAPAPLHTAEVRTGVVEQTLRLTGATLAERSVQLRAPYLRGRRSTGASDFGLVLQELTPSGSHVRKNDVVAAFDRLYMRNRLDNYEAARVERELGLKTLRADQDVKRAAYEQQVLAAKARMDKAALDLKTSPVRSAIQAAQFGLSFEEAQASYRALEEQEPYVRIGEESDVRLAQLELREAQVEERRAAANVEKMAARAPVDGLLVVNETFRGSEFGQIQTGDQLRPGQLFAQVVDSGSIIIEASANQVDVEGLRIGAPARVGLDAYGGLELPARVYSIGPLAKSRGWRASYVSEVPVYLRLDRIDPRLIPNLTVRADVVLRRESSPLIIPRAAVFADGEGRPVAYVRTGEGWEMRELELGLANNVEVSVRAGVRAGDVVAVSAPPLPPA
jgi:hypothetical protein